MADMILSEGESVCNSTESSPYARAGYWLSKRRDGRSQNWMIARWQDHNRCIVYRSCKTTDLERAKEALDRHVDQAQPVRSPIPSRKTGSVYFIQGENGPIKIGAALDVEGRLAQLRTMSPAALTLLAQCAGGQAVEFAYHKRFATHRLHGEWFSPAPEILAEIERLHGEQPA